MKLAQINLTRGIFIPGLGNTSKVENMECEQGHGGIRVTTSAAKVLIPWDRVELVVEEWIGVNLQGIAAAAAGAQAHGTGMFASMDRGQNERTSHRCTGCEWFVDTTMMTEEAVVAAVHAHLKADHNDTAAATRVVPQPPPPQKKGGKGR